MTPPSPPPSPDNAEILDRLARIEDALQTLVREKTVKEWYSTAEAAKLLQRSEYSVREWCRQKRVFASKRSYARGKYPEWQISHAELQRIRNEGLRPIAKLP